MWSWLNFKINFMEEKIKSKKGDNQEKIKWHHARWFWGGVLGVVFVLLFAFYNILPAITYDFRGYNLFEKMILFFRYHLPLGALITLSVIFRFNPFFIFESMLHQWIIYLLIAVYYLLYYSLIILLLFKIFKNKMVKIKYLIILTAILVFSVFGIMVSSIAS